MGLAKEHHTQKRVEKHTWIKNSETLGLQSVPRPTNETVNYIYAAIIYYASIEQ
jgi:hypothetical protein